MSGAPIGEGLGEPLPMLHFQEQAVFMGPTAAILEEGKAEKREDLSDFRYVFNLAKVFLHTSSKMFLNLRSVLIQNSQ